MKEYMMFDTSKKPYDVIAIIYKNNNERVAIVDLISKKLYLAGRILSAQERNKQAKLKEKYKHFEIKKCSLMKIPTELQGQWEKFKFSSNLLNL